MEIFYSFSKFFGRIIMKYILRGKCYKYIDEGSDFEMLVGFVFIVIMIIVFAFSV